MTTQIVNRNGRLTGLVALFSLLMLAAPARAQMQGTVVELAGSVVIQHRGQAEEPVRVGQDVIVGDTLRTGPSGRIRVVFADHSVLAMGEEAQLLVDEASFDEGKGTAQTLWRLVQGRVRAVVGEYYENVGSRFHIETTTAVAGVRGTEFIMTFDPVAEVSEVVGVSGRVEVHGVADRVGHTVYITTQELSSIARGGFPTASKRLPEERYRQYLQKLSFFGVGGANGGLAQTHPVANGRTVVGSESAEQAIAPSTIVSFPAQTAAASSASSSASQQLGPAIIERPDAGTLVQNSPGVVVRSRGSLGLRF